MGLDGRNAVKTTVLGMINSLVENFEQALPVRRRYGQLAGFSQLTIHGVPNLSTNMPNRRAQNVSPIGI